VDWLRLSGRPSPASTPEAGAPASVAVEAAAPGVAALLEGVPEGRTRSVLDLGSGSPESLEAYHRFARRIRFADLLGYAISPRGRGPVEDLLREIPAQPDAPYDLVFAWDVLDRLFPEYHGPLVTRLVEVTAPEARLHVVARGSAESVMRPLRFSLLGTDRMRYEPAGRDRPALPRLLPAQVAHILEPFRVTRGFTLKGEMREYVAVR
jgi:hypothetical protein